MSLHIDQELVDAAFAVVMCIIIGLTFICVMKED